MPVDAIVNATDIHLSGGGGVDAMIHRAAGPELRDACRALGGCETGMAKITRGYRLPCRYVIHTAGPVWVDGSRGERALLASCYRRSLDLAAEYGLESVAFPLISTGAYGFPKEEAISIAADTIQDFLLSHEMTVYLVVFDKQSFSISQGLYDRIQALIDDAYAELEFSRMSVRPIPHNAPFPPPAAQRKNEAKKAGAFRFRKAQKERPDASSGLVWSESAVSLDDYLAVMDEGFRDMLLRKIDERHMTDAECYKKANIDRKLFNKIKNQPEYRPGKSTVLALAVALRLPLQETQEMLKKAGFSLSHSSKFDLIVEYFILHEKYDVFEINQALFSFDQKLLGSAG